MNDYDFTESELTAIAQNRPFYEEDYEEHEEKSLYCECCGDEIDIADDYYNIEGSIFCKFCMDNFKVRRIDDGI